jgi:hypothetical protein
MPKKIRLDFSAADSSGYTFENVGDQKRPQRLIEVHFQITLVVPERSEREVVLIPGPVRLQKTGKCKEGLTLL